MSQIMHHHGMEADLDLLCSPFEDPVVYQARNTLVTPMRGILQQYRELMSSINKSIIHLFQCE